MKAAMPIKPELLWVPESAPVHAWLRLPSDKDDEQPIRIRVDEIKCVRPLSSSVGGGAEITVDRGYVKTSVSPSEIEALMERARKELAALANGGRP